MNKALFVMGYITKKDVCEYGLRMMTCNSLIEPELWLIVETLRTQLCMEGGLS